MALPAGIFGGVFAAHELIARLGGYDYVVGLWRQYWAPTILFSGYTGSGKTQIFNRIQGDNRKIERTARTRISKEEVQKLDEHFLKMIELPGGEPRLFERKQAIQKVRKRDEVGVVHVIANGFVEPDVGLETAAMPDPEAGSWRARLEYLEDAGAKELAALNEMVGLLRFADIKPGFFLVLLNKADLWWGPDESANQRIVDAYKRDISQILYSELQLTNVTVLPCAARIQRFFDRVPVSGNYDESLRDEQYDEVLRTLYELAFQTAARR